MPSISLSSDADDQTAPALDFTPPVRRDLAPGDIIDNVYRVISQIGSGGGGSVYQVQQMMLGRDFAMKVLQDDFSDVAIRRFHKEAKIAGSFEHENLVRAFHYGALPDGRQFFIMDYIQGRSLAQRLDQGPLSQAQLFSIFLPICSALSYAHDRGLVHRDLKPANIVLIEPNGSIVPKIIDFGIARVTGTTSATTEGLTKTGQVFGTPKYMSPEQCLGNKVDTRSDIYSLGCTIFESLTGGVPFLGNNPMATIMMHISNPVPDLESSCPGLQHIAGWQAFFDKILAKDPRERYQDCQAVHLALQNIKSGRFANDTIGDLTQTAKASSKAGFWLVLATCASLFIASVVLVCGYYFAPQQNASPGKTNISSVAPSAVQPVTEGSLQQAEDVYANALNSAVKGKDIVVTNPESQKMLDEARQLAKNGDWMQAQGMCAASLRLMEKDPVISVAPISLRYALIALCTLKRDIADDEPALLVAGQNHIDVAISLKTDESAYFRLRAAIERRSNKISQAITDENLAKSYAKSSSDSPFARELKLWSSFAGKKSKQSIEHDKLTSLKEKARHLMEQRDWSNAHAQLSELIHKTVALDQQMSRTTDVSDLSLYYAMISYCLLKESQASNRKDTHLQLAQNHLAEAFRIAPAPPQYWILQAKIYEAQGNHLSAQNALIQAKAALKLHGASKQDAQLKQVMTLQ